MVQSTKHFCGFTAKQRCGILLSNWRSWREVSGSLQSPNWFKGVWCVILHLNKDLLPFCHKSDFSFKILFILVWSIHTRLKEILCVDLRVSPSLDHHRNNLLSLRIQFLQFLPDLLSKVSKNSVLWRSSSQPSPLYITFTWTNSHIRFTPMCVHH